jgi:partner of Y14 and mago
MSNPTKSGIQTGSDGASFVPSSTRPDGSTRKEIKVRPGYRPPEDVETYKNQSAKSWKNRGAGGVPGADPTPRSADSEGKSKNAKRREAARKKANTEDSQDSELASVMEKSRIEDEEKVKEAWRSPDKLATNQAQPDDADAERQKKIRNTLKKLKALRELKEKKSQGEKLSHDQLMKIGKESELVRDLNKLAYDGPETEVSESNGNG